MHEPVALVLDEPFSGLDPLAVDVMAELLREQVEAAVPVLFSNHQLELVERLCDDVVIVSAGRVVAAGAAEELRRSGEDTYAVHVASDGDVGWIGGVDGVRVLDVDATETEQVVVFQTARPGVDQDVLRQALERGAVHQLRRRSPTLAEIFREAMA